MDTMTHAASLSTTSTLGIVLFCQWQLATNRIDQGKRTDLTSAQNGTRLTTAEKIGEQYGISKNTVKRERILDRAGIMDGKEIRL